MTVIQKQAHNVTHTSDKNLTPAKKAQYDLETSELRYRRLFETAQDGILLIDFDTGMILDANKFLIDLLGYSKKDFLEKHLWEIGIFKDIAASKENFSTLQKKRYVRFEDLPLETKSGGKIYVEFVANAYQVDGETIIQCNVRDITDRKKAEILLKENQEMLNESQRIAGLGTYVLDIPADHWESSKVLDTLFGTDKSYNTTTSGWTNLIHPDDRKMMTTYFNNEVIEKRKSFDKIYRIVRHNDHAVRWVHGLGRLVFNSQNNPIKMIGTIQDITKQKLAEQALKESEDKFSRIFESSPYAVVITNIEDGKFINVNKAFTTISGVSREEALESTTLDLGIWANKEDRTRVLKELKTKGSLDNVEFPFKTKTHGLLTGLYSARLIEINGKTHILSSIANISDLKHAQEEIEDLEKRNEATLSSIGDAVFSCDKNGKILVFNRVAEKLTGISAPLAIGRRYDKVITFVNEVDEKPVGDFVSDILKRNKAIKKLSHTLLITKRGEKIPVANSIAPVKRPSGEVVGCVVSFRDINMEREIDRAKTEFVSIASHQLRTPLTAVSWYCEMLLTDKSGELNSKQKIYATEAYKANRRMSSLLDALLNVSRLDMGTFMVEPKLTDIKKVVKNSIKDLNPLISKKKIKLIEMYDEKIDKVKIDPALLSIVIQNLLSNSVKYTKVGGKINLITDKKDKDMIISVEDNGIGIPQDQQSRVFSKLFRADNVMQVDPNGTGLGLYIVKSILDRSGGKIWFESKEDKGTKFTISLPLSGMIKKKGTKQLIQNE